MRPNEKFFIILHRKQSLFDMKIKEEWAKVADRKMAGDHVVIKQGRLGSDVTNLLQFNDTGIFLWRELKGKEFDASTVADLLVGQFGIDRETAEKDAEKFIAQLRDNKLTDEE